MAATIHTLHSRPPVIGGFLRIGHTGQRRLEALHAAGRLRFSRFVFDAAHIEEQTDLLKALKASGCEIVLDPNFAEMAELGRFGSAVSKLPWANPGTRWEAKDFGRGSNLNPGRLIAEFAAKFGVSAVLTPTHLIESEDEEWRDVDRRLSESLRRELDRLGGSGIGLDYQLITNNGQLRDPAARAKFKETIGDLPVQNLWLRISGFGATATGAGTRAFIESVRGFHDLGFPVIADATGGFAGLAAAAFGSVSGICHGVCQKESFDSNQWKRPSTGGGGGSAVRIYVPELDRYLDEHQFNAVIGAKGGRARLGCTDTSCCPHGAEDQVEHADSHMLTHRHRQIADLSSVPETRRSEHLLLRHIDPSVRAARLCSRLKIEDEKVSEVVGKAKERLIRLRDALGDLHAKEDKPTRSKSLTFRGGSSAINAVLGG